MWFLFETEVRDSSLRWIVRLCDNKVVGTLNKWILTADASIINLLFLSELTSVFTCDPPAAAASASGWTWSVCRVVTPSPSPSSSLWSCWSPPGRRHRSSSSSWRSAPFLRVEPRCCSDLWTPRGDRCSPRFWQNRLLNTLIYDEVFVKLMTFPSDSWCCSPLTPRPDHQGF